MSNNADGFRKYVIDSYKPKKKIIAIILCFCFGMFGTHRMYMGKKGWLWWPVLMVLTAGMLYWVTVFELIALLVMSDKKFHMICQVKGNVVLELKILSMPEDELDKFAHDLCMNMPEDVYGNKYTNQKEEKDEKEENNLSTRLENTIKEINDTVSNIYEQKGAIDSDEHEHIKEDKALSKKINEAQDRLDRFQNNNYYPTTTTILSSKEKKAKRKELKEELQAGLISKEEYNEEILKLDLLI